MSENPEHFSLSSDSSLAKPEEDLLGYDDFAEHLAEVIIGKTPENEFVIGVYGDWGSGKSTLLNFIREHIDRKTSEEDAPIILNFNPWWFSGERDLFERYFLQLQAELPPDQFEELRNKISKYTYVLSQAPLDRIAGIQGIEEAAEAFSQVVGTNEPNLNELKEAISEKLLEFDTKIIVIIDDIDRLTNEEIRQVFGIVKSVADFENIIYLLAFDRSVVVEALSEDTSEGEEYLDKIVQLPIQLPSPEQHAIEDIFLSQLTQTLEEDWEPTNEERFQGMIRDGISPLLTTPRDAVRLSNVFAISYSVFESGEVNVTDLLGIEALRVFHHETFAEIRNSPDRFVGAYAGLTTAARQFYEDDEEEEFADVVENSPESIDDPIIKILSYLFPKCSEEFDRSTPLEDMSSFRKRRRICHAEMFDFYFRLSVPRDGISVENIRKFVEFDDAEEVKNHLVNFRNEDTHSQRKKSHVFLAQLDEFADQVEQENAESLLAGLYMISEELIEDDIKGDIVYPKHRDLLKNITFELLSGSDTKDNLLSTAIDSSNSLSFSVFIVSELTALSESDPDSHLIEDFTSDMNTEDIQSVLIEKISNAAEEQRLLDSCQPLTVLKYWLQHDESEAKNWIEECISNDDRLFDFIEGIVLSDHRGWKADPEWLDEVIGLSEIEDRLDLLGKSSDEENSKSMTRFKEGKRYFEEGGDPSQIH